MKLNLSLNSKDWESAITKAAIEEIEKRIRKNVGRVRSEVKAIVAEAIANSPEIQALLNDEALVGSFGFYGGSAEQQANAIIKSVAETTEVIVSPYRSKSNPLLTVNVQPKHLGNLLALPEGIIRTRDYDLNWLEWLLTKGDTIVVVGWEYEPGKGMGRSRLGHMIEGGSWRVDPRYSGNIDNNFVTRSLTSDETLAKVMKVLERALS